jgi:adenylyltransferase/sulfurtransferase
MVMASIALLAKGRTAPATPHGASRRPFVTASIVLPPHLWRHAGGARTVEVDAPTVGLALAALVEGRAELREQLFDGSGTLRRSVVLRLGDRNAAGLGSGVDTVTLRDGDVLTLALSPVGRSAETLSHDEILRYSRHLVLPEVTIEGQRRLKSARVLCVGAGGLGSPLLMYLAAAGVGKLGVADFDTVDVTNLQRQVLYRTADVGCPKTEVATQRLAQHNPEIEIVAHELRVSCGNIVDLLEAYDIVADCTDNFSARYLINDACVISGKPYVYAGVSRFEGQVSVFDASRGPCYRCLFPEPPAADLVPSCVAGGVLGVLAGVIGSLQALEVLKLALGLGESLVGRLVLFDAIGFAFREVRVDRNPRCFVCGASTGVVTPLSRETLCDPRAPAMGGDCASAPTITVEDFHRRRLAGEAFTLLDVRESHECRIASIPGAVPFPLSELPERLRELDPGRAYTLHCHTTTRSLKAYQILRDAGFGRLQILVGGVDAWAARIDTIMPRY